MRTPNRFVFGALSAALVLLAPSCRGAGDDAEPGATDTTTGATRAAVTTTATAPIPTIVSTPATTDVPATTPSPPSVDWRAASRGDLPALRRRTHRPGNRRDRRWFQGERRSAPPHPRLCAGTAGFRAARGPGNRRGALPARRRRRRGCALGRRGGGSRRRSVSRRESLERYFDALWQAAAMYVVAGVPCGQDPARADNANLNVMLERGTWQLATGLGSIWVSERIGDRVVRVEPNTGTVLAVVNVGSEPLKLQPADGRMCVRTTDAYVAIDPATDTVTATLAKVDVSPAANRSWAVDGALWICDGQRLHRYDPVTVEPIAVVELEIDCGQVHATTEPDRVDLQRGRRRIRRLRAAFVDPATTRRSPRSTSP